jgi:(p)ppGpp synthase/HD superfamily hydrolase
VSVSHAPHPQLVAALADPTPVSGPTLAAKAKMIASRAHDGQLDAAGAPYAGHLMRTAARATTILGRMGHRAGLDRFEIEAIAWLHDTCEDTFVTPEHLIAAGFPISVVDPVMRLTHRDEPRAEYLAGVTGSLAATIVKIADTLDNTDEVRLAKIADPDRQARLRAKYAGQLDLLLAATGGAVDRSML